MGIVFGNNPDVPFKIGTTLELIGESVSRIIMTLPGERLGLPDFGSNVRLYLFENDIFEIQKLIKLELLAVLETQEPRIILRSITLTSVSEDLRAFVLALEIAEKENPSQTKVLFIPLSE